MRVERTTLGIAGVASLVLAVVVLGWWLVLVGGEAAVPTAEDARVARLPNSAPPPTAPDVASADGTLRESSNSGSLRGRVLACDGSALAGFGVRLVARQAASVNGAAGLPVAADAVARATSDAQGAFAWPHVPAADYHVALDALADVVCEATVRVGAACEVELRLAHVLVEGRLQRADAASEHHVAWVRDAAASAHLLRPGPDRTLRAQLPPGSYRLAVLQPGVVATLAGPNRVLCEHELRVPSGVARTTFVFPIGGTELVVTARVTNGASLRGFGVDLQRLASGDRDSRDYRALASADAGPVRFADVPPGRWSVHVHAPWLLPTPAQEFTADATLDRVELTFPVQVGCEVELRVRTAAGAWSLPPELLPALQAGVHMAPCVPLGRGGPNLRARHIGYECVPFGAARIEWQDRQLGDRVSFLPFESQAATELAVVPDGANVVDLVVLPRARVDLRACDAAGREDAAATLTLWTGARRAQGLPSEPQRWSGWLPPGDYRAVVATGAREFARDVRVDRADVVLRLRP